VYYGKQWESGEACKVLKERLSSTEEKSQRRIAVGDVVCLGLGSLQIARREGRRASFTQLAALRTIMGLLGMFSHGTVTQATC
jgi:hypothetical protein